MILRKLVAQGHSDGTTLAAEMAAALQDIEFDRLDVAVAYATQPGLAALRKAIGGWPAAMRWVVGLDDAITQPTAIDQLISLPAAQLRLASLSAEGRRFHPKLYCFWSSTKPATCLAVIGSANMTLHGLSRNGEVGAVLVAEDANEADMLKHIWSEMNALGRDVADWDLEGYRDAHGKARKARHRMVKIGALTAAPDADEEEIQFQVFNGNPASATVAWTEGASPSAGGRDLEFPRLMMPFFGLTTSPTVRRFRMDNGETFPLTFTMRTDNQMWRLMFSRDAIYAGTARESLRPVASDSNRSDLAIVFKRSSQESDYEVHFVTIGGPDHDALLAHTRDLGVLNRTRDPGGRYFGYY